MRYTQESAQNSPPPEAGRSRRQDRPRPHPRHRGLRIIQYILMTIGLGTVIYGICLLLGRVLAMLYPIVH